MPRRIALAIVLSVGLPALAWAQTPRVDVDQRVELLGIVFKLAGNPEYNQVRLPSYDADIERQFGLFKNHPGITAARTARDVDGLTGDAAMSLATNISPAPMLLERQPFDAKTGESRWRTPASSKFLVEVRRFAV